LPHPNPHIPAADTVVLLAQRWKIKKLLPKIESSQTLTLNG
jgi:hypothetical protein